jgi:prephenate dehydratase
LEGRIMDGTKVGYQGAGSVLRGGGASALPDAAAIAHRGLLTVFDDVASGGLAVGVVPLENSQAGSINETYDLLGRGKVWIVGEAILRIDHALLALPGTRLEDVHRVSSHPQALVQCGEFLARLEAEIVPVYDTAGAAKRIAGERLHGEAAVASARAAGIYGLEILASRINLSKLESRPVGPTPWQYRFYVDVDAGASHPAFGEAIEELRDRAASVQILGSYARWEEHPAVDP